METDNESIFNLSEERQDESNDSPFQDKDEPAEMDNGPSDDEMPVRAAEISPDDQDLEVENGLLQSLKDEDREGKVKADGDNCKAWLGHEIIFENLSTMNKRLQSLERAKAKNSVGEIVEPTPANVNVETLLPHLSEEIPKLDVIKDLIAKVDEMYKKLEMLWDDRNRQLTGKF